MPSEMIWDTESLFQHSHPHTSGGLRSVAAAEVSMAAAAELQGFGPTQLCLSPAISPALAVPCALPYPSHQSHVRLPRVKFRSWQEKKFAVKSREREERVSKSGSSLQAQGPGGCWGQRDVGMDHYWCHIRGSQNTLAQGWHCANGQNTAKLPPPCLGNLWSKQTAKPECLLLSLFFFFLRMSAVLQGSCGVGNS